MKGLLCLGFLALGGGVLAQTTQGLIAGRVVDSQSGAPVAGARIDYTSINTGASGQTVTEASGYYVLPLLSPGIYRLRAAAAAFQAQEVQQLELRVAARVDISFRLRPLSDVWEAGLYRSVFLPDSDAVVTFYGPDVDSSRFGSFTANRGSESALEVSLSQVIDPAQVRDLPLSGRDIYAMLLTQPGVTADTASIRGLGLSAAGQRPTASNFLLDGAENNDYRLTGRLTAAAPEAVQEYRISTSNFSAEYGRTAGFLANAITRAGTSAWHGMGYYNRRDESLNAATFQRNLRGLGRAPGSENQAGFHVGGPAARSKSLLVSSALDYLRSRTEADPVDLLLPAPGFAASFTRPDGIARRLLTQFPAPAAATGGGLLFAPYTTAPPVSLDRWLLLERVDYRSPGGRQQLMGRLSLSRLSRPDFIWTPYEDFVSGLKQNSTSMAVNWQSALTARLTSEARFSFRDENLYWDRARPDIPTLVDSTGGVLLPGSPAFYEFDYPNRAWEFTENVLWAQGRHVVKFGGGLLMRRIESRLSAGRDGLYQFFDLLDFGADIPSFLFAPLSRRQLPSFQLPVYERRYRQNQFFFFAQDTFRPAARLVLNLGLRYERFGAPENTGGEKDAVVELGGGADFGERLAAARLGFPGGGKRLYGADTNDWAARLGVSYDLRGNASTVLRGAYGIYYDRPFDNLWMNVRNNNMVFANLELPGLPINYLEPLGDSLRRYQGQRFAGDFPLLTMLDPALRNAYVQSYLLAVQQRLGESWSLEVTGLGALGRKLLTTDIVNRTGSVAGAAGNQSRFNPALFDVAWRSNQGASSYHGLAAALRYRSGAGQFHAAYTWSHSIDNQSDALAGDFFDLSFTGRPSDRPRPRSTFTRQFDSAADRGSSDFDQRHNLVFFSLWNLPSPRQASPVAALLRDWKFSQLAAFRTGFPYTPLSGSLAGGSSAQLINNRPNLLSEDNAAGDTAVPGGRRLLNAAAFGRPAGGEIGSLGRNALYGPGLVNLDVSLSRSFPLPWLGESARATFRADAYNVLNHANLNAPAAVFGLSDFGVARYGRRGVESGFPPLTPLEESARQVQLILRVEF